MHFPYSTTTLLTNAYLIKIYNPETTKNDGVYRDEMSEPNGKETLIHPVDWKQLYHFAYWHYSLSHVICIFIAIALLSFVSPT